MPRRLALTLVVLALAGGGAATAVAVARGGGGAGKEAHATGGASPSATVVAAAATSTTSTSTSSTSSTTTVPPVAPALAVAVPTRAPVLAGCPPPAPPPGVAGTPPPTPWHPALLVPDAALPPDGAPAPWASDPAAVTGKGMWVWQLPNTEGGDVGAIVRRARGAGLHQIWVRVGDSKDGFYAAPDLATLVPAAHRAGIAVIGWGFPYLYDPVADAVWTLDAVEWRGPSGDRLDGFSADIERASEGVALSARRVAAYLGTVRGAAGDALLVATVYPPTDGNWYGDYPYTVMSRYVDVFAPMIYWECTDPAADAVAALRRLGALRPVHVIGQAFNLAGAGGRVPSPSAAETAWFLHAAQQGGAVGASLWVWQSATADEWAAVATYPWSSP